MTTKTTSLLPQGVGQLGRGWLALIGGSLVGIAVGLAAFVYEQANGMVVTGMRDLGAMQGATWGIYIGLVVYFVGVSFAGITVAALIRLFNLEKLKSVARMAEVLTVVALILGALAIVVDLGQPLRGIVNLFRYARPQSPFFGTFSLVISGYLFASLLYLYLTARPDAAKLAARPSRLQWFFRLWAAGYRDTPEQRAIDRRTSFWLALAILPLLIVAHSSLGFVFGLQAGRPGWFGSLQAPSFVVLAGVSGVGHLIILAAIVKRVVPEGRRIGTEAFAWLGRFLMVLVLAYLYFTVVEVLTTVYQAGTTEQAISNALLRGEYALLFWGSVVVLTVPALMLGWMAIKRSWSVPWLVAAGILVNLGAIGKRYLVVVPSQTHGQLLPYGVGSYAPTWVEYGVALGLFALGAFLIAAFAKIFPIMELEEGEA